MNEEFFYTRSKDTHQLYLNVKNKDKSYYKSFPYIPTKFECNTIKEQKNLIRNFNLKYLSWALFKLSKLKNINEYDYFVTRARLINYSITPLFNFGFCFTTYKLLKKTVNPFNFEIILGPSLIKKGSLFNFGFCGLLFMVLNKMLLNKLQKDDFLFRTALKYRIFFNDESWKSPNCGDLLSKIDTDLLKIIL